MPDHRVRPAAALRSTSDVTPQNRLEFGAGTGTSVPHRSWQLVFPTTNCNDPYPSDPSPTNIARTLSESSGVRVSIRSFPARPSSSFSV